MRPAIVIDEKWAQIVFIDKTGNGHTTTDKTQHRFWTIVAAHTWGGKWAGPRGAQYDLDTKWDCYGIDDLREASISRLTKAITLKKYQPPNSEEGWRTRGIDLKWKKTWKMKPKYIAPRDIITWLKVQHRTLWVAKNGGMAGTLCLGHNCREDESQLHLIQCRVIRSEFWHEIIYDMEELGLIPEDLVDQAFSDSTQKWGALLIAGQINNKPLKSEATSYLCWAWRQLYAEIIDNRVNSRADLNTKSAMANDQDGLQQNSSLRTQMETMVPQAAILARGAEQNNA